jgi:hypothetical protein
MDRRECLDELYRALDDLRIKVGGFRQLAGVDGRMKWPARGVYFFFEAGEMREGARTPRVVRVGTHAVSRNSQTKLWTRLSQHRGSLKGRYAGGGNHRGSVFRYLLGDALIHSERFPPELLSPSWGTGYSAPVEIRLAEHALELEVSARLRAMPLLWLDIDDLPGPASLRKFIERNSIALLSNFHRQPIDPASSTWLGLGSPQAKIRESGLWNIDHVGEEWSPLFLERFRRIVLQME